MPNKYKDSDVPSYVGRLYTYRPTRKIWVVTGYKCHKCQKHYNTIRAELFTHIESCTGPKEKRKLDD